MFTDKKQKTIKYKTKSHKVKYGFINKNKNNSIYINIGSWVQILVDDESDYPREFRNISKKIKTLLHNTLDPKMFDSINHIVDLDIRQNGLSSKIKSYMNCEITLFKQSGFFEPNDELNLEMKKIIDCINNECFNNSEKFKYYATK